MSQETPQTDGFYAMLAVTLRGKQQREQDYLRKRANRQRRKKQKPTGTDRDYQADQPLETWLLTLLGSIQVFGRLNERQAAGASVAEIVEMCAQVRAGLPGYDAIYVDTLKSFVLVPQGKLPH